MAPEMSRMGSERAASSSAIDDGVVGTEFRLHALVPEEY